MISPRNETQCVIVLRCSVAYIIDVTLHKTINMLSVFSKQTIENEETRRRFETLIGEFGTGLLTGSPNHIVISGSIVFDALDNTNFAEDIAVYCVKGVLPGLLSRAEQYKLTVKEIQLVLGDDLGAVAHYHITGSVRTFDVWVCLSPLHTVHFFDLPHDRIAFDGKFLWVHESWPGSKNAVIPEPPHVINKFFLYLSESPVGKQYVELHKNFGTVFIQMMIRIGKFGERGYRVIDKTGLELHLTVAELDALRELGRQKVESESKGFNSYNSTEPFMGLAGMNLTE